MQPLECWSYKPALPKRLRRPARPQAINTEERRHAELLSANSTARRQLASLQDKLSRIEQQVRREHSRPPPAPLAAAASGVRQILAGIFLGVVWGLGYYSCPAAVPACCKPLVGVCVTVCRASSRWRLLPRWWRSS